MASKNTWADKEQFNSNSTWSTISSQYSIFGDHNRGTPEAMYFRKFLRTTHVNLPANQISR